MSYKKRSIYKSREELLSIPPEFIEKLPQKEKDIYYYYCKKKMRQVDISKLLNVSQAAISHRINRLVQRIIILEKIKSFNFEESLKDLEKLFNPFEIELLRAMYETSCQTETARRLNILFNLEGDLKHNQITVRYRFGKYLRRMEKAPYYEYFKLINDNLYIRHEVALPQFDRR